MPKQRTKKPRRIVRKTKHGNLGLFVLAGILGSVILWLLIKDPLPEQLTQKPETQVAEKRQHPKKHKQKEKKPSESSENRSATNKPILPGKPETAVTEKPIKPETPDLDKAIVETLAKLGIPKNYYKRRKSSDLITYSVPINKASMDLLYANMIFKGELERKGGTLIKGTDSSAKQSLLFSSKHNPEKFQINLYYDSKLYETTKNPKTIAIVVDDFGAIGGDLLEGFLSLDTEVCFAIFPDEQYSQITMQKAKAQGRTTIIHVPMEPIGYPSVNPGKNAIFVQYDEDKIDKLLTRFINQLPNCEGINNHMGSLATTDEDVMRAVMNTLKKHDMFFLDSRTSNVSVGYAVAQKAHIRSYRNDLFLDSPNVSQSTMDAKLKQIIDLSATRNNIIAITHCHNNEKLQYLKRFIARLKAAGFTIVPITEIGKYKVPELL